MNIWSSTLRLWSPLERWVFHQGLYKDPIQTRKARLMMVCCLASGTTCMGLIVLGFLQNPLAWDIYLIVGLGHMLICGTFILLRYFPTMSVPSIAILVMTIAQLLNATWWSGGPLSSVLFAYPVATVFLGMVGDQRHSLICAVSLSIGACVFFGLGNSNIQFGAGPATPEILLGTLIWAVLTGAGISVYTQYQTDKLLQKASTEVAHRRVAQEEAEQANRAKNLFMAYLSHEIRNPLAVIMGSVEMINFSDVHGQKRYSQAAIAATQGLSKIFDDILDFASLEREGLRIQLEEVDINKLIEDLIQVHSVTAEQKGLILSWYPNDVEPAWGDKERLRQVLNNVVGNAIKYTDIGSVSVRVTMETQRVSVEVMDTGPGIPNELKAQIFYPFERAHGGRVPGAGLGLAISQGLLKKMDSKLHLISPEKEGSIFRFSLPVASTSPQPPK